MLFCINFSTEFLMRKNCETIEKSTNLQKIMNWHALCVIYRHERTERKG